MGTHRQTTIETNETIHKKKMNRSFDDLEKTALSLSSDITLALSMEIEDLPSHKTEFRAKMQNTFMHVLKTATLREEQVIFFSDAVPGFALMLFKKKPMDEVFDTPIEWDIYSDEDSPEAYAASVLAEQFFKNTKTKIDALLITITEVLVYLRNNYNESITPDHFCEQLNLKNIIALQNSQKLPTYLQLKLTQYLSSLQGYSESEPDEYYARLDHAFKQKPIALSIGYLTGMGETYAKNIV